MNNFELISFQTSDELAQSAAAAWLDEIETANRAGNRHCVALSGGRVTQKFFADAVALAQTRETSFANVHFFWADERCVPPTDAESNFKLANELLFAPLKIAENQIHRLRGELAPAAAVEIAIIELKQIVTNQTNDCPILDLILLGMGEDGHIASLFPGALATILDATAPFLVIENSPKPPPTRISLSYACIAAAKKIWVLASGNGKAAALHESLDSQGKTPLARVIRSHPQIKIFSDITPI
ncbi:MAG TPA: 6-phosphogluconolactonase [Verrucomicrobiae bacterium]|jgi:6-phosphogluconolactonase